MILNMTSGGSAGCVLTVTAPAGVVVTVSKDGKRKTQTAASGTAVFRGLEGGQWTVTISDGEQTAEKTVTVKNDYEAELTFFAATINVTYPAGSTCTATDGVTTLTAPDTSGTWACVVPNTGTWTVSAEGCETGTAAITDNGQDVSITLYGIVPITSDTWTFSRTRIWGTPTDYNGVTNSISNGTISITVSETTGEVKRPAGYIYNKKLDLTGINTVNGTISLSGNINGNGVARFAITQSETNMIADGVYAAQSDLGASGTKSFKIDTSKLSGEYYLVFGFCGWGASNVKCTCTGITYI